jgi:predicted transcriptional regulator of viral defense system
LKQNIETASLQSWVNDLEGKGKMSFSFKDVSSAFQGKSRMSPKRSLHRLSEMNRIVSIYRGYYLIVPAEYESRGILPPPIFLDTFMKFLKRPYYVGLLSAAAFHGAAHQQPQEFFVMTNYPLLRPILKRGVKVNYISTKYIPTHSLEKRKTETGTLNISAPELTAADLLTFYKRVGGFNRLLEILFELHEKIRPERLNSIFIKSLPAATIQRLGFLFGRYLKREDLAEKMLSECKKANRKFYSVRLKSSGKSDGRKADRVWKVVDNAGISFKQ